MKDKLNKYEWVSLVTIIGYFITTFIMSHIYHNVAKFNTVWSVVLLAITLTVILICHFFNPDLQ